MWVPKTRQLLIIINPYIDKLKQSAKLLIDYFIQSSLKYKLPTSKPKPCNQSKKPLCL